MKKYIIISLSIILSLPVIIVIIYFIGAWRFREETEDKKSEILKASRKYDEVVTEQSIKDLPEPVQKWLINSGVIGKPGVSTVFLKQKGQMKLDPEAKNWMEAEAQQTFATEKPAFVWSLKTNLSGFPVYGRDGFQDGKGSMVISLGGLFSVVNVENNEKGNKASLQRYLAEIVWFPSAALNSHIKWESIDDFSSKATMNYQGTEGEMTFYFNESGEVDRLETMRYKGVEKDDREEKWIGYIRKTEEINGIRIPTEVDIAWFLVGDQEEFIWYKLQVFDVEFN